MGRASEQVGAPGRVEGLRGWSGAAGAGGGSGIGQAAGPGAGVGAGARVTPGAAAGAPGGGWVSSPAQGSSRTPLIAPPAVKRARRVSVT